MSEAALVGFQFAEIADSLWDMFSVFLLLLGAGIWIHATYFRKSDKDE